MRQLLIAGILVLSALAGCAGPSDTDQLRIARQRLHPIGCGDSMAVSAVAGVNADPHQVYLGDWLVVSVCHLDQLVRAADAAQAPITLFVEGRDTGNEPVGIDVETGTLTFTFDRTEQNRQLWRPFLYNPLFDAEASVRVSAGIHGDRPLPRAPGANLVVRLRKIYVDWTTWAWTGFLVLVVTAMIALAASTDMLRDAPSTGATRRPYSLGRVQMAWWFLLVVISYGFIWLVTGDRDTIPPSVLGLMGISSVTALAAAAIPSRRDDDAAARETQGWWRDLVTDDQQTIAFDRLQIVVWTLVLGFVFLTSVLWDLTMPEFNATLLALMGISSGTYLGFKLPGRTTEPPRPPHSSGGTTATPD